MLADFLDAHERHWTDAEGLFAAERFANADHLYGMATECGLKRLMMRFGMTVDEKGNPTKRQDWKHVKDIWARFETYRSGKVEGVDYGLPTPSPFDNCSVDDRYAHQSHFDKVRVQSHQTGARTVRNLVAKAQREGLI